ncbi:MAG: hypothetical protein ACRETL_02460, partial [Gammaproteobacteria bacterium]
MRDSLDSCGKLTIQSDETVTTIRDFCEAIYCGLVPGDAFSIRSDGEIACDVHVTKFARERTYSVRFGDVRGLERTGRPSIAGDPLELSVIEVER